MLRQKLNINRTPCINHFHTVCPLHCINRRYGTTNGKIQLKYLLKGPEPCTLNGRLYQQSHYHHCQSPSVGYQLH